MRCDQAVASSQWVLREVATARSRKTRVRTEKTSVLGVGNRLDQQPHHRGAGGQAHTRADRRHRGPCLRVSRRGEVDQPGRQPTDGGSGGDALHRPCDHQGQDTVGRPEDRRTGRCQQECGERHRTAFQAIARGTEGQQGTGQSPTTYTAKTTVTMVTEKSQRSR